MKLIDKFSFQGGRLQVLMGPNGSGKSTLAREIVKGHKGVFLGFQQPVSVPGVNYIDFLRLASRTKLGPLEFFQHLKDKAKFLEIPEEYLSRCLNDQFSGGEKKRMEMFQALVLQPKYAIFDEPDSGVDAHNLKLITKGIRLLQKNGTGILLITHSSALIKKLKPVKVYGLKNGQLC